MKIAPEQFKQGFKSLAAHFSNAEDLQALSAGMAQRLRSYASRALREYRRNAPGTSPERAAPLQGDSYEFR